MEELLGPIDVLVNNAGVAVQQVALKHTKREWEEVNTPWPRTAQERNEAVIVAHLRKFGGRVREHF